MIRKFLFGTLMFFASNIFAQSSMNFQLLFYVQQHLNSTESIPLLVRGDVQQIETTVKNLGGTFKFSTGNIAAVNLSCNQIFELASQNFVQRIEGKQATGKTLDQPSLINNDVLAVHQGISPLTQPYTGHGVCVGFIDTGIDPLHPDFTNADGSTKIKFLWDQNSSSASGSPPAGFPYGQEWDSTQINLGTSLYAEPSGYFGHGSNVSGLAISSGRACNNYKGVAPDAQTVVVDVELNQNFLNDMVDATNYIFQKASDLGMPCVINASVGTYGGSHDGKDLAAEAIASLVSAHNGQAFVCAAGNAGGYPFHLGYDVTSDSSFTWFYYEPNLGNANFDIFSDTADFNNVYFSIGADKRVPFAYRGRTRWINALADFSIPATGGIDSLKDTLWNGTHRLGLINYYLSLDQGTYDLFVLIHPDSLSPVPQHFWRFSTKGQGHIDCYSDYAYIGNSTMVEFSGLPTVGAYPDMVHYQYQDFNQNIVSSFTCNDKTITVGNYTNATTYIAVNGIPQFISGETTGHIASTSSWGPTRDGRWKPNLDAPGSGTLCTSRVGTALIYQYSNPGKLGLGGWHNLNGGTSMAAPCVAGIAALYLEKNPNASWNEIKYALQLSARRDNITTQNLPDKIWGYGKADAFDCLNTNIVFGCTDPFSINFNPNANADDGSCQAIVFGCTDAQAQNYNPSANMNNGSCTYGVGVNPISTSNQFIVSPNPSHDFSMINFNFSNEKNMVLQICDITGKVLDEINLENNNGAISYNRILPAGIYICRMTSAGKLLAQIKLVRN